MLHEVTDHSVPDTAADVASVGFVFGNVEFGRKVGSFGEHFDQVYGVSVEAVLAGQ